MPVDGALDVKREDGGVVRYDSSRMMTKGVLRRTSCSRPLNSSTAALLSSSRVPHEDDDIKRLIAGRGSSGGDSRGGDPVA